jgi:hypothetical protein
VRVGRAALDEEAIRLIEEHNPDVEFDWTRILKGQAEEASKPAGRQDRPERPGRRREEYRAPRTAARAHGPSLETGPSPAEPRAAAEASAAPVAPEYREREPDTAADFDLVEDSALLEGIPDDLATPEPLVLEDIADGALDVVVEERVEKRVSAAQARLGSEGISRLRARYAEVMTRVSERAADPATAAELKARAERLNPDTWVTADEVTQGLEEYEAVFESLRAIVGRNRKRRRRRRGVSTGTSASEPPPVADEARPHREGSNDEDDESGAEEL